MIDIQFVGAAQEVTGSKHLVHTKHATVLLDCGMFQGRRRDSIEKNKHLGFDATKVDVAVLSHAHIDHSGALPFLVKNGFEGSIYATPATRDLCAVMLEDAANIQESDARYINKTIERDHVDMDRVEPLYQQKDVAGVLSRMIGVPYRTPISLADGVKLTFFDAGHVLGSAVVILDIEDEGKVKRLVFTGDLGRNNMPILRDPEIVGGASTLLIESTYGDRLHEPIGAMEGELGGIISRVYKRGGKIVIPSFALERAQEVIYALKRLRIRGEIPPIPVFVDSPLTVKITDIFKLHPECYDEETRALIAGHASPFDFEALRYVSTVEDSKGIDADKHPAIIISASGMCEAGRILHHLKATVEDPANAVCLVGFQAQHTLGRRISERRPRVKIFGVERDLRAEVYSLSGFSAHADQKDLLSYVDELKKTGSLEHVALVHGEPPAQRVLRDKMMERGMKRVDIPASGDVLSV